MSNQKDRKTDQSRKDSVSSQHEINRRKFVHKILASMPAVGLVCAVPMLADAGEKTVDWVCRIDVTLKTSTFWVYTYVNCQTQSIYVEIGEPNLSANGDCGSPAEPDCETLANFLRREKSDDDFNVFYSPKLSETGRKDFVSFKNLLSYSMQYG